MDLRDELLLLSAASENVVIALELQSVELRLELLVESRALPSKWHQEESSKGPNGKQDALQMLRETHKDVVGLVELAEDLLTLEKHLVGAPRNHELLILRLNSLKNSLAHHHHQLQVSVNKPHKAHLLRRESVAGSFEARVSLAEMLRIDALVLDLTDADQVANDVVAISLRVPRYSDA